MTKTYAVAVLEAYNEALAHGTQRNPGRCSTPRQIADEAVRCLVELSKSIPALMGPLDDLQDAFLLNRPIPPGPLLGGEWWEVEAAVAACFDVTAAVRARDAAAAWRAANAASSNYRDAEARLLLEKRELQRKSAAAEQLVAAQKAGVEANRAERDSRCERAIKLWLTGKWDSKDAAATAIAAMPGFGKFSTVRGYLRPSGKKTSDQVHISENVCSLEAVARSRVSQK